MRDDIIKDIVNKSEPTPTTSVWYLYVLYLSNEDCYVGITTCPDRRFKEHQDGYASDVRLKFGLPIQIHVISEFVGHRAAREAEKLVHVWLGRKSCNG